MSHGPRRGLHLLWPASSAIPSLTAVCTESQACCNGSPECSQAECSNADARVLGMEVTRPAAWKDKVSKVRPPSSLFNYFRLTGPYSQSLSRATPPPGVVEKCVPVGSQSWRLDSNMVDCLPQIEAVFMGLGSCEWLDDLLLAIAWCLLSEFSLIPLWPFNFESWWQTS